MEKKLKKEKYGLKSHETRFGTEEQCRQFLVDKKWDGRPKCHHCGNQHMNYFLTSRSIWKCSSCKKQFSVRKDTIFEDSKLPLTTWFKALYYFTSYKRSLSSCQLAKLLEIEQRTAWFLLHRLRAVIKEDNSAVLEGIVEVDETFVGPQITRDTRLQSAKKRHDEEQEKIHGLSKGKRRRLRGHPLKSGGQPGKRQTKAEKALKGDRVPFEKPAVILGMAQRGGKVVLRVVGLGERTRTKANIYPMMHQHITGNTTVLYTDETNLYDAIGKEFKSHEKVNHKEKEYVRGDTHVNTVESIWLHFDKMLFGTYFKMAFWHLHRYVDEHAFRWNIRKLSEREKINAFLDNLLGKRLKYQDLIIPKNAA